MLRVAELEALPVDVVVLGHIHKPQLVGASLPPAKAILHTGALTRRDFGEAGDRRVCWIYNTGPRRSLELIDLPARRFVTVDPTKAVTESVKDAYVRCVYRATEEEAARVDPDELRKMANELGAFYFAGTFPEIIRTDRGRAEGLTESTDPLAALQKWLDLRSDISEATRQRVNTAAAELLEEVGV